MEKDDYRDQQAAPTGGMTGEDSGLQANNLSPRGQGQPKKKKKKPIDSRVVMQPYGEQAVDSRYNRFNQPQDQVQQFQPQNQSMPGRAPLGVPGSFAGGWNQMAQQHGDRPTTNQAAQDPNWYARLQQNAGPQQQQNGSLVAQWMKRNGGVNPQDALASAGQPYDGGGLPPFGEMDMSPTKGGLHDAFKQSVAGGYTDIQDTNPWQTGQYMGQLQGFNTQGWGSGERGSGTLKNRFGQIASRYDVTQPGALQALMKDPQFQEMTGGQATIVEHPNQDLIDFDGPGPMAPVDVIGNAVEGGAGQNWWWGPTDEQGGGPQAPANQIYNQALQMPQGGMPQGGLEGFDPQQQQGQAMQFLQWLLQQQQQGNMTNGGLGDAPMF